jgi:hypothetical protein
MGSAFYLPEGEGFRPTELTRGPWDPMAQHAGPPAALIGRELEQQVGTGWFLGRVTYEILRPVPLEPLRVAVEVVRPGRSVQLLAATLSDERGEVIRASAWCLATRELELPPGLPVGEPPPGPETGGEEPFFDTGQEVGYHTAMEYRFVSGSFLEPGPATVWMRMRHPLVEGEQPTPLQRVLIAADTGNGASATVDLATQIFINVDLTVHLHRLPEGEWVCLEAVTLPEVHGVGLADSRLHDERGPIGRALQTLLLRSR